ncbi:MAG: phosphomannomutase/phosphoglucomutase [Nitrospirota bacterium]|nr:phosphomannomutase/phosphoglucomutase [Nitrospirota bacterium]
MAGIFKAYDIRGTVPDPLNPELAHLIGRALGEWLKSGMVLVTHDMRTHSPELSDALILGLREAGRDVLHAGLGSTPMNYWANVHYRADASVSVTASHNAGHYNGFKVSLSEARPVGFDTGIGEIEKQVHAWQRDGPPTPRPLGKLSRQEGALDAYMDAMDAFLSPITRPLKIAVDCANGMGGHFIRKFFDRHPELTAVPLYWDLDGTFPNHEADPLKAENMADVQAATKKHACDVGAAFDGDADRCMFTDEQGTIIPSDLLIGLLAEEVLKNHPGCPILHDLRSSRAVPERIRELGGEPIRGRVGHAFMKALMRERGAKFGGELSGHYYFADLANTDSGLMALIRVINRLQANAAPLSAQMAPLRRYFATGEINYRVPEVGPVLAEIERRYAATGTKPDKLDGLTVECGDWWFNLRASNTEPLLRLNLEAGTATDRDVRLKEVSGLIHELGGKPAGGH